MAGRNITIVFDNGIEKVLYGGGNEATLSRSIRSSIEC